jgi:hypothetical protein
MTGVSITVVVHYSNQNAVTIASFRIFVEFFEERGSRIRAQEVINFMFTAQLGTIGRFYSF